MRSKHTSIRFARLRGGAAQERDDGAAGESRHDRIQKPKFRHPVGALTLAKGTPRFSRS